MKKLNRVWALILFWAISTQAAALVSVCDSFEASGVTYIVHDAIYTSGDAAQGPTLGLYSTQSSPFPVQDYQYFSTNPSGGMDSVAAIISDAGTYIFTGISGIGFLDIEGFFNYVILSNQCSGVYTFSAPTGVSVDISPSTVYEGQPTTISWDSNGADYCTWQTQTLAPSGSIYFAQAAMSDGFSE